MFEYLVCALACLRLSIQIADEALTCRSPVESKAIDRLEKAKGAVLRATAHY
jgi:hypothetical protein